MSLLTRAILNATCGSHIGKLLFNSCLFFASYLNFVCFLLKKFSRIFRFEIHKNVEGNTSRKHILLENKEFLIKENPEIASSCLMNNAYCLPIKRIEKLKMSQVSSDMNALNEFFNNETTSETFLNILHKKDYEYNSKSFNASGCDNESDFYEESSTDINFKDDCSDEYDFDFIDTVYEDKNNV